MSFDLIYEIFMRASLLIKIVMGLLLLLSIISWAIIFNRYFVFRRISKSDTNIYNKFWSGTSFVTLTQEVNQLKQPAGLARIFNDGVVVYQQTKQLTSQTPEAVLDLINKKLTATVTEEVEHQDFGLNLLSIITGIAPYIGLFGTVWGIIDVFTSLGGAEQVNITVIAPGISEALFATAMGLFVAIPALAFYYIFNRKVQFNENQYFNFQDQFVSIIQDDIYRRLNVVKAEPTETTANNTPSVFKQFYKQ